VDEVPDIFCGQEIKTTSFPADYLFTSALPGRLDPEGNNGTGALLRLASDAIGLLNFVENGLL